MASRDSDLKKLHPDMRKKVKAVLKKLEDERIPFRLFEGYRTPKRQTWLYAQGRTRSGPRVTKAKAWESLHQYGVAGDFVLFLDGTWSWSTSGPHATWWTRLHEVGVEVGLKALSWEKPHLQMVGVARGDLQAGRYPEGGDASWAENLEDMIVNWSGSPAAPPLPTGIQDRPALDSDGDDSDLELDLGTGTKPTGGRFRVTARGGLRLRGGPGTGYETLGKLPPGKIVRSLGLHGEWMQVDSEGDGLADGFCHGAYLDPV